MHMHHCSCGDSFEKYEQLYDHIQEIEDGQVHREIIVRDSGGLSESGEQFLCACGDQFSSRAKLWDHIENPPNDGETHFIMS